MNGYTSSPRTGYGSHGVANGAIPNGYGSSTPRQGGNSGFVLNRRKERIDWRRIASVNIDHLSRTLDVEILRENISSIAYCDIEEEVDTRVVDQNFVKIFKMSQLIIQYLVHTQDYFTETVKSLKEEVSACQKREEAQRVEVRVVTEQLNKVKQENHKRKKLLKAQQNLIQTGVNNYHQCMYCPKAFTQTGFLQSHLLRKHPQFVSQATVAHESQIERTKIDEMQEKLEREMEELRERLKGTQSQLVEERGRLEEQLEQQRQDQVEKAEAKAKEEAMRSQFVQWKEEQTQSHKAEMERLQSMFMKEMKEMHENYSISQSALEDLQSKLGKKSNLGTLVDEDEIIEQRKLIKQQHSEMERMKAEYEDKLQEARDSLEQERGELEKRWESKLKDQKKRYSKDTKELRALLENMASSLKEERRGGSESEKRHRKEIQDVLKKSKEYEAQLRQREIELQEARIIKETKQKTEAARPPPSPNPPQLPSSSPESEESEEELIESEELTKQKIVETMRKQINNTLQLRLEQKGVAKGVQGISNQAMDIKMRQLKQDRQSIAKRHPKFYDIREQIRRSIEGKNKDDVKRGKTQVKSVNAVGGSTIQHPKPANQSSSNTFPRSKAKPKSILSKPKDHDNKRPVRSNSLPGSSARRKTPPPVAPRDQGRGSPSILRTGTSEIRTPAQRSQPSTSTPNDRNPTRTSAPRVSFEDDLSESDEDDEDDEDDDSEDLSLEDEEESEVVPLTKPHPQPRQAPPVTIPRADLNTNGNAQGSDLDDTDWDSEDVSALDEVSPGKIQPGRSRPSSSTPKGPMVAELSKSIEAQLQGRHSNKKPLGRVDLSGTRRNGSHSPDHGTASPSPRIPTIPDAGEESDDSLAISSLEGSLSSPPKPQFKSQQSSGAKLQPGHPNSRSSDASNTYGTSVWGTSSNKATSAHGTTQQSTKGTNKSSLVSVTDFDDDDDLDLSDL